MRESWRVPLSPLWFLLKIMCRLRNHGVPWRPPSRAVYKYGDQGHDVSYDESREGVFLVTLDEEQGEVTSAEEGHNVERVEFGVLSVVAGGEDDQ